MDKQVLGEASLGSGAEEQYQKKATKSTKGCVSYVLISFLFLLSMKCLEKLEGRDAGRGGVGGSCPL